MMQAAASATVNPTTINATSQVPAAFSIVETKPMDAYNYMIYVDPTTGYYDAQAANGTICWSSTVLSTVANDAFSSGDSIYFANGAYYVTSPLLPQNDSIIFGAGNTEFIRDLTYMGPIFEIFSVENSTIEDLTINGNGNGYQLNLHGVSIINSQSIVVSNNLITNTGHDGVNILNSYNCTVTNNIIENTYLSGVYIQGLNSQITVSDNHISNTQAQGIDTYNASFDIFSDNTFTSCGFGADGDVGIYLLESSDNTVAGNSITNSEAGINLEFGSDYNTISANTVGYNLGGGISITGNVVWFGTTLQCNFNTVSGNTIINNGLYGVGVYNGTDNLITGNTIQNNTQSGVVIDANSQRNIVDANNIGFNVQYGLNLAGSYTTVKGNSINNGITYGVLVASSSDNNLFSGDTFNNNKWWGIQISVGATSNSVLSCNASYDGSGGINNLGTNSDIHFCQNNNSWVG
jgi:parallel beta-helix repeat protein